MSGPLSEQQFQCQSCGGWSSREGLCPRCFSETSEAELLDRFAGLAMQAIFPIGLSDGRLSPAEASCDRADYCKKVAKAAYLMARAMLAAKEGATDG